MAYPKCPRCGRAIAKIRVVAIDTDPFRFTPDELRGPMRLGFLCPHEACRAELTETETGRPPPETLA